MPERIYKVGDQSYNVKDEDVGSFIKEFPGAKEIVVMKGDDGNEYNVEHKDYDSFVKEFPKAVIVGGAAPLKKKSEPSVPGPLRSLEASIPWQRQLPQSKSKSTYTSSYDEIRNKVFNHAVAKADNTRTVKPIVEPGNFQTKQDVEKSLLETSADERYKDKTFQDQENIYYRGAKYPKSEYTVLDDAIFPKQKPGTFSGIAQEFNKGMSEAVLRPVSGAFSAMRDLSIDLSDAMGAKVPEKVANVNDPNYNETWASDPVGRFIKLINKADDLYHFDAERTPMEEGVGKTIVSTVPLVMMLASPGKVMPLKAAAEKSTAHMVGETVFNPLTKYLTAKEGLSAYNEARKQGLTESEAVKEGAKGAASGFQSGFMMNGMMGVGKGVTGKIVESMYRNGQLRSLEGIGEKLLTANNVGLVFGGTNAMEQVLDGNKEFKDIDLGKVADEMAMGAVFEIPGIGSSAAEHVSKAVINRGISKVIRTDNAIHNFFNTPINDITKVNDMDGSAKDYQERSVSSALKAANEDNVDAKNGHYASQITYQKIADIKKMTDAILKDKDGVLKSIDDMKIPEAEKVKLRDKVEQTYEDNQPAEKEIRKIGNEITNMQDRFNELDQAKKSTDPVIQARAELEQEGLKEKIQAKKESLRNAITERDKQQKKEEKNAVQKQGAGEVLQRQPEETGEAGGERVGMEPSKQGEEVTGTRKEPEKVAPLEGVYATPDLETFNLGEFEGSKQTEEKNKTVQDNIVNHPEHPMAPGGESFANAYHRVGDFMRGVIENAKDGAVVVTHNTVFGLIRAMNKHGFFNQDKFTNKSDEHFVSILKMIDKMESAAKGGERWGSPESLMYLDNRLEDLGIDADANTFYDSKGWNDTAANKVRDEILDKRKSAQFPEDLNIPETLREVPEKDLLSDKSFREEYSKMDSTPGDSFDIKTPDGRTIHIVRHGETADNEKGVFRTTNTELTPKGVEDARALADKFGGAPEIYASHLPRTVETANIIRDKNYAPRGQEPTVEQDPEIRKLMIEKEEAKDEQTKEEIQYEIDQKTGFPRITSTKNAVVDAERAKRGLPQLMKAAKKTFQQTWDNAMKTIEKDPGYGERLVDELNRKPRFITDEENAILLHYKIEKHNEFHNLVDEIKEAEAEDNGIKAASLSIRLASLSDRLQDIDNATRVSGTEAGRGLNIRKMMANEDFSLAGMETKMRSVMKGKPLTPEQRELMNKLHDKIKDLEDKLSKREEKFKEEGSKKAHDESVAEDVKEAAKSKGAEDVKKRKKTEQDFKDKAKEELSALKKEGSPELEFRNPEAISPDLASSARGLQKIYVREALESGEKPNADAIVKRMYKEFKSDFGEDLPFNEGDLRDAISGYGKTKRPSSAALPKALRSVNRELRDISTIEFLDEDMRPLKSGFQRDAVTPEERERQRLIRNKMREKADVLGKEPRKETDLATALDAVKSRLKNRIEDIRKQLATGVKPEKATGIKYDEEAQALKEEADQWSDLLHTLEGRPTMTDAQKLANYKTRLNNLKADYEQRIEEGDFEARKKEKLKPDEEALRLQDEVKKVKNQWQQEVEKQRKKELSGPARIQENMVKYARFGMLSAATTLAKLGAAAVWRIGSTVAEDAIGKGLSKAFPRLAKKAYREGGGLESEVDAWIAARKKAGKDAYDTLIHGESELDRSYGQANKDEIGVASIPGRLHGVIKSPVKRLEFERSYRQRMLNMAADGIDVTDPVIQHMIKIDAYKDAKKSIFMGDNKVANAWNVAMRYLDTAPKEGEADTKALATLGRIMMPFVRIPTNIAAETGTYVGGVPIGVVRMAKAYIKGIENVDPKEADLIMRAMKKGSIGIAGLLIGYYNPGNVGGYYSKGRKDTEDIGSLTVFGQKIPKYLVHNPLLETLQIGATFRKFMDGQLKGLSEEERDAVHAAVATTLAFGEEIPMLPLVKKLSSAMEPGRKADRFVGELLKSATIPALVQELAKVQDEYKYGKIKRDPKTILEHWETGVPFLNEKVPVKRYDQ